MTGASGAGVADGARHPGRGAAKQVVAFRPAVDLGILDPIEIDGQRHSTGDHHLVSLRWLLGTVLTGLTGALLVGLSIFAELGHRNMLLKGPEVALTARPASHGTELNPRRRDRLSQPVDITAAKQTYAVSVAIKIGTQEMMGKEFFTHVATPLTLAGLGYSDEVPKFNPLDMISGSHLDLPGATAMPLSSDTGVTFQTTDIEAANVPGALEGRLHESEVEAQIVAHGKAESSLSGSSNEPLAPQKLLMQTSEAASAALQGGAQRKLNASDFNSIRVRMVDANVTTLMKSRSPGRLKPDLALVVAGHNQSIADLLEKAGVDKASARNVARVLARQPRGLYHEGEQVKLQFAGAARELVRVALFDGDKPLTTFALGDNGRFALQASAAASQSTAQQTSADDRITLYDSLYQTALHQHLPKPIIHELVQIFANDVDLLAAVRPGDALQVFYTDSVLKKNLHTLLYASLRTEDGMHRYYRYRSEGSRYVDYYDADGHSSRKFLIRKPISGGRMSSPFGWRFHPILHINRLHTGVDWAAPIGTPIVAAGNGTIIKAGWSTGYGRRVEIQHAYGYVTTYNHMSAFGRGITTGAHVRQGQIVGYVGMSGLATGPHLHYEVKINGQYQDPLKVKLAHSKDLDSNDKRRFEAERRRIDSYMAQAPNALALMAENKPH
ncbi:MAG: M23 family metallopeptidase [Hyphomicrobiales bacterium]|nr:M23 family metallopeptidase [Hyphomicrobiales bacterium]